MVPSVLLLSLFGTQAPAPTIDPQARAAVDRMVAAYRTLTSFSAEVRTLNADATVVYQRPGRIVVAAKDGKVNPALVDPISRTVSDGTSLYSVSPSRPKIYLKEPTPEEPALLDAAIGPILQGGFVRFLLRGDDPIGSFLASGTGVRLTGLAMGLPGAFEGVGTETVVASFADSEQKEAIAVSYEIGTEDHLLRRLSFLPKGAPPEAARAVETHLGVRANPTLAPDTFTFVPPPGAVAARVFEEPLAPALKPGAKPFPLGANDLAGHPVAWESLKGKVVLLDFWATWCMPCVAEIPHLAGLKAAHAAQGFEIISVSADAAKDRAKLAAFVKAREMAWPQIHDTQGAIVRRYGVKSFPTTLLIGRDGRVAAVNLRDKELDAAILQALKGR